jgi:glycosyltransferase 2 family protein
VHRGLRHGRNVGDVGRGLRSVVWERTAGQAVQAGLTVVVLLALPSPARSAMPGVAVVAVLAALCLVLVGRALPRDGTGRWGRAVRAARADLRDGLLARRAWPAIVLASTVIVAGHAATFLIAARTAGVTASPTRMLPLALLVLLAMVLPSIGGWGPREGAAAWVFGAAGLGAGPGVATAVVYGVMAIVAGLPGAGVLIAGWLHRRRRRPEPVEPAARRVPAAAGVDGGSRG